MDLQHRNSQKRFYIKEACYFVTTVTHERYPYFKEPIFGELFVENLKICKALKQFKLFGWFLGYDHCHLLFQPGEGANYSEIMFSVKKQSAHDINRIMGWNNLYINPTPEGAQTFARLQGEYDVRKFRFQFLQKYPNHHPFPLFRWQKSFHDHYIRNPADFVNHLAYIAGNPAKHNMPEDWPYIFTNPKYEILLDDF